MAAAAVLPNATLARSQGMLFSCQSGNYNDFGTLNSPDASTACAATVTPLCLTTVPGLQSCSTTLTANGVRVTQTVSVPTYFIRALALFHMTSHTTISLTAYATAAMKGNQRGPYNVAVVLDTTASMASPDNGSSCTTQTKIACALQGVQILMQQLDPCANGLSSCGTVTNRNVVNPVDEVALFTFPAQTAGTLVTNDEACPSKSPSVIAYPDIIANTTLSGTPPTLSSANLTTLTSMYMVEALASDFRPNDVLTNPPTPTLSLSSGIVDAVGGNSYYGGSTGSCTGMQAKGGVQTFYAGALFTAQQYLLANARTNAQNVIILLGDGDANGATMAHTGSTYLNSDGTYPSQNDQCQQAITIANAAKATGTIIYVVGYGVASSGCNDGGSMTACKALYQVASPGDFYRDASSITTGYCSSTGGYATDVVMNGKTNTISNIFIQITGQLSKSRLVPDGTT
jgi:hypothetical protein